MIFEIKTISFFYGKEKDVNLSKISESSIFKSIIPEFNQIEKCCHSFKVFITFTKN